MEIKIKIKKIGSNLIDVFIISDNTTIAFELLDNYEQLELLEILKQAANDIEFQNNDLVF